MRTQRLSFALFLLLVGPASVFGEKFTLKVKDNPDVGMSVVVRKTERNTGSTKFVSEDGKILHESSNPGENVVYTRVILKKDGKKATSVLHAYKKARSIVKGKEVVRSHEGRTVLFEQKAGRIRVGVVGNTPLAPKDVEELAKYAKNMFDDRGSDSEPFLPDKPVEVGETWKIKIDNLAKTFAADTIDLKASTGQAKLLKVYRKDGKLMGVIRLTFQLLFKRFGGVECLTPIPFTGDGTLETAIDGSTTAGTMQMTMTMKGKSQITIRGIKASLVMDMAGKLQEERSAEKEDPKLRKVPTVRYLRLPSDWKEFTSRSGGYVVRFPGKPKKSIKKGKSEVTTSVLVETDGGAVAYIATHTDFTNDITKVDPKKLLHAVVRDMGKAVTSSKAIRVLGYPGVEVSRGFGPGIEGLQRVILAKGRLYQLFVVWQKGKKDKAEIQKFFDSFRLKKVKGI